MNFKMYSAYSTKFWRYNMIVWLMELFKNFVANLQVDTVKTYEKVNTCHILGWVRLYAIRSFLACR